MRPARAGVAVSDSPTGPYCFVSSSRVCPGIFPLNMTEEERDMQWNMEQFEEWWTPEWREAVNKGLFVKRDLEGGQMSRDMTLYVDDDGIAYHIYSSEENLTLQIAELTDDYLSHRTFRTSVSFRGDTMRHRPSSRKTALTG